MRVFEMCFQFHTSSKEENIKLSENVFRQNSQISGIFKKSMLDFKDALFRLSNQFLE